MFAYLQREKANIMVTKMKAVKPKAAKPKAAQWPFPANEETTRLASTQKLGVLATLKNVELVKAGSALTLELTDGGTVLGRLEVGSGSFFWYGPKKRKAKKVDWKAFAEMMEAI